MNGIYELPFGPGKAFLSHSKGLISTLVGGWQLGSVLSYRTGYPLALSAAITGGGNRPNSTGRSAALPGDRSRAQKISQWFDTTAFTVPASFTYGNVGRLLPDVRGPALTNLDISLLKNTRITERINTQLRGEAFNALNTPHLWMPNTTATSVQFGQISSTTGNPRVLQVALKVTF